MALKAMHQVLIVSGLLLGLLMMGFSLIRYAGGDASVLPTGALGGVATVALALYLRWFRRKQAS